MTAHAQDSALPKQSDPQEHRWLSRISVTNFRSYAAATIEVGPEPVVLVGENGAGKTNLLEAISLLSPGSGLRRAQYAELGRIAGGGDWAVAARVETRLGAIDIGTGQMAASSLAAGSPEESRQRPAKRIVRVDGEPVGPAQLASLVDVVWLTPAMDGLFTGAASERRRFLDRLTLCFDTAHASTSARFERAMRQRNRLLEDGERGGALLDSLEMQMAETGAAIAAARLATVAALQAASQLRRARAPDSPFPWFELELQGTLETALADTSAVDVEDAYRTRLGAQRDRDRGAGRTLEGPHRSDLLVTHGPKSMPAAISSTGEQKALLTGLVLAHAGLIAESGGRGAPLLLLDEVAAHFDEHRRAALFEEILALGTQAWMTGTDQSAFSALQNRARIVRVEGGLLTRFQDA